MIDQGCLTELDLDTFKADDAQQAYDLDTVVRRPLEALS